MPLTAQPKPAAAESATRPSKHRLQRVMYPWLPAILDSDTLSAIGTLESEERAFAIARGKGRHQYLHGLYLKAMAVLCHSHFQPKDLPRQFRLRIIAQLGLEDRLASILEITRGEKSRIVTAVRKFLQISRATHEELSQVQQWLRAGLAQKETDIAVLTNATIERFRSIGVEIPSRNALHSLAQRALKEAMNDVLTTIDHHLTPTEKRTLDQLLSGKGNRTPFDDLKTPVAQATPNNLATTLCRIEQLQSFLPLSTPTVARHHLERFAGQAERYTAPEMAQLGQLSRQALLFGFLFNKRAFLLDAVADMALRIWDNTRHQATEYANLQLQSMSRAYEQQQETLTALLSIIQMSHDPEELWHNIHRYKDEKAYGLLLDDLKSIESWNGCYFRKIEDHYPTLRRFLPQWYRLVPLCSITMDDAIPQAHAFAKRHVQADETELPPKECPVDFLPPPWKNKAVKRYQRTQKVVRIFKMPYELGLFDATIKGIKQRTLAIVNAQRHGPMTDHLLPREKFLSQYQAYVQRLGHPLQAEEYYNTKRTRLNEGLTHFDRHYSKISGQFWVNQDGTLGYSRPSGTRTLTPRLKRLAHVLGRQIPEVSILDVLLDCHCWTGFMDAFKPIGGRQNMAEKERLRHLLAALYAYGCNCGPTQAARALQLLKNQVVYIRRRYMTTSNLMDAAAMISQVYQQTPMAQRLGNLNVLMTDSMQVRTLKDSLIARQHHRYLSGKSTLIYQHVAPNCICLFTQALICNVSEAIHMLVGTLACHSEQEPIVNICDSAGKSNLVFGLSRLLNIKLYPRVRSRHLKLWGTGDGTEYKNIADAITGQIRWERIERSWQDIMWILASIDAGTAKPIVILNHLASNPRHPAAQGLEELGKLERSLYLLRYGMEMDLRRFVVSHTSRREHWNKFAREVLAFGDLIREKTLENQEEIFWFLTVVQNAIVLWNALSLENVLQSSGGIEGLSEEDLKRILPTMTEHINFVGEFNPDFNRKPPFKLRRAIT
ncbi:hypothetical protein DSCO28_14380 [Desulfosarcina ovata subsp. sediminis]|uniref:Transposase n=1 Tax=Desulfosarcina ovata subsp. sediminis TaxID=885957 RepID=A0A5K7ZFL3_9BACT|nr:Tn3 family transposase [Desulfosarcina ovata]BBO80872.1 hypothetical protein DSCO28_14380 [Desulfosarcina ovata subsp. sediminis]